MSGLRSIQEKHAQWQAARPNNGRSLFLRTDDIVFAHFIGTGNDPDPYMEVYLGHEIPATEQGGYAQVRYCPVLSEHDLSYECEHCGTALKIKERMQMWFYVTDILHATLKDGETLPAVAYAGRNYFRREMNRPMTWDSSAWRESPLDEIIWIHGQLGNLQSKQMVLRATGDGLKRRYRITAVDGSAPFNEAVLNDHAGVVRPIREILLEGIVQIGTQSRPEAAPYDPTAGAGVTPTPYPVNMGAPVPGFNPPIAFDPTATVAPPPQFNPSAPAPAAEAVDGSVPADAAY